MRAIEFYNTYYQFAKNNEDKTGVPALVCLAQAALESGWGKAAKGNNFFGIKAGKSWKGKVQKFRTKEVINNETVSIEDYFRKYDSVEECFNDYADLLIKRFPKAFNYKDNPEAFINSVQNEHAYKYATDPKYAQKVILIINQLREYHNE